MGAASNEDRGTPRFFVTYSGVKLPFNLVSELQPDEVQNRNTFFRGYFDAQGRITGFEKIAYGEVELKHDYAYHDNGKLKQAQITDIDGEATLLEFDADGGPA